jgi:hypothetical protein
MRRTRPLAANAGVIGSVEASGEPPRPADRREPWFDAMSKLYSILLLVASLFAMAGLGMAILVAVTEIHHLIAPTNNPYGMNR